MEDICGANAACLDRPVPCRGAEPAGEGCPFLPAPPSAPLGCPAGSEPGAEGRLMLPPTPQREAQPQPQRGPTLPPTDPARAATATFPRPGSGGRSCHRAEDILGARNLLGFADCRPWLAPDLASIPQTRSRSANRSQPWGRADRHWDAGVLQKATVPCDALSLLTQNELIVGANAVGLGAVLVQDSQNVERANAAVYVTRWALTGQGGGGTVRPETRKSAPAPPSSAGARFCVSGATTKFFLTRGRMV